MTFRISSLPEHLFQPLFSMTDDDLHRGGARRYVADRRPGFPCRVSLDDAAPGETVILARFTHLDADSPFRASGPVFVREGAGRAMPAVGEVPAMLRQRPLSVRAYDATSLMVAAEVTDGQALESAIERLFGDTRAAFLHVHFAKPGCYACRVDRA